MVLVELFFMGGRPALGLGAENEASADDSDNTSFVRVSGYSSRMGLFATRYVTRFSCIGAQCEDNCCHSWSVPVDKEHYELLRAQMSSPDELLELQRSVRVVEGQGSTHALMVLQANGNCSMLDAGRLCKIQKRFGQEALPNTCALYPKSAGRIGDRFELMGTPSCPEMARLILLGDDALEFVPSEREAFPRSLLQREIDLDATDSYRRSFFPVRELMLQLLRETAFPVDARLFFLAFFADKARTTLREKPQASDADAAQLFQLMQAMRDSETLKPLADQWARTIVQAPFGLSVVRELLMPKSKKVPAPITQLIAEIRTTYDARSVKLEGPLEALFSGFEAQRPSLSDRAAARVDQYLSRYAQEHVAREWFMLQPSLMQYVMGLLARVAVLRFLLFSHPVLHAVAAREDDAAIAELDALAIRCVYGLSRMLEHDEPLARKLVAELEKQGMTQLEHAICLGKI